MLALSQPIFGAIEEVLVTIINGQTTKFRPSQNRRQTPTNKQKNDSPKSAASNEITILPGTERIAAELAKCISSAKPTPVDFLVRQNKNQAILTISSSNATLTLNKSGVMTIQKRGFRSKTLLNRLAQQEQKDSESFKATLFGNKLKDAWQSFSVNDKSIFNRLLDNTHTQAKDKIKIAFAEGYQAGKLFRKRLGIPWIAFLISVYLGYQIYKIVTGNGNIRISTLVNPSQVQPESVNITFNDVKGIDEAKEEVMKIVDYLKDPEKYTKLGARLPKGILLVGPPGCGKTLLAKAIAGEAKVPFFRTSGSEFEEVFVGVGAKRIRDLFTSARSQAPCVIFIDEIDSVGSKRTSSAVHPYANQSINQLLTEMDGFQPSTGVIVLAATNRRKDLDPALMRPGRFDVEVQIHPPDLSSRFQIFSHYLSKITTTSDIDVNKLAKSTIGYSAADIENLVNQAALKAATDGKVAVDMLYLDMANDLIRMGVAKKKLPQDKQTNINTAHHEAGHALVAFFTKDAHPVHKVTITPRGGSLGHTSFAPEKEMYGLTKAQLMAQIDVGMGGRVAEELLGGADNVTTGALSDFQSATSIAESMVRSYGMSDKVGVRFYGTKPWEVQMGDHTKDLLDTEVKRILSESYERAKTLLKLHAAAHKRLADALLEHETLTADEMKKVIEGEPLNKKLPLPAV